MICRWCGEKLDPTQQKCPACGRHTEPASACGGFFDLAPSLEQRLPKAQQAEKLEPSAVGSVDRPGSGSSSNSTAGGKRLRKKRRRVWWLWPGLVAVLAVGLVVMSVLYFGARAELEDLQDTQAPTPQASASASASPEPSDAPAASDVSEATPIKDFLAGYDKLMSQTVKAAVKAAKLPSEETTTVDVPEEVSKAFAAVKDTLNSLFD